MLVRPSKWLKQIIQIKHNRVKNPNWPEANQLGIYQRYQGYIWTRDYHEQIQQAVREGLELGASELQVQRSNRSATKTVTEVIDPQNEDFELIYCCQQLQFWQAMTERLSRFLADK